MAIEFGPKDRYRTYGVPSLDLPFADRKSLVDRISGNNLITFTRSTTGTYVGSDGLIKTAAANEPRFDHNPLTRESLGLLVEEARTNQALYSSDFSNAAWVEAGTTKTANALAALDGTTTAALVVPTAVSATHKIRQSVSTTDSALTFSIYLKAAGYSRIALNEQAQIGASSAIINLADGTGATSGTVVSNAGNGWYRVSWSSTFGAAIPKMFGVVVLPTGGSGENPNSFTWTGNGTSGIYVWGAQLEAGAFPTSYIPTTASTVTRAADIASITGSNFSSWYNNTEGTVFTDFRLEADRNGTRWAAQIGPTALTGPNSNVIGKVETNLAYAETRDGSATQYSASRTFPSSRRAKIAYAIKNLSHQAAFDGVLATAGTGTLGTPSNTVLLLGRNVASTEILCGTIARLTYYPTRLPDTTLQELTKL
jgi:hypothetical protein